MTEPTFDADGYPTEETLECIRKWDCKTFADMHAAMHFAGRAWSYPDYWTCERNWVDPEWGDGKAQCRRYTFSTGGWSGNESIVGAIEENVMLRVVGAYSWRRGGHYEYRFPEVAGEQGREHGN